MTATKRGLRRVAARNRLLRIATTFAVLLAVWLGVRTARAAESGAPLCDARGATTFAPVPQLQPLLLSIGEVPETPCGDDSAFQRSVGQSSGLTWEVSAPDAAAVPASLVLPSLWGSAVWFPESVASPGPSGVLASFDRPPRA